MIDSVNITLIYVPTVNTAEHLTATSEQVAELTYKIDLLVPKADQLIEQGLIIEDKINTILESYQP
jgi:hypothetical protein